MIIGTKQLLEMVKNQNLVERLCDRELNNPEGEGFDLRVGEVFKLKGEIGGFLGITGRCTPKTELIAKYGKDKKVIFIPGDYGLVKTIEKVNLPDYVSAICTPRTTLQRSGVILITSNTSPGYSGELTFGMFNAGPLPFKLELGARITTIIFNH